MRTRTCVRIATFLSLTLSNTHTHNPHPNSLLSSWQSISTSMNRFFWNKECVHDLIACKADEWIVPFMSAFVEFQPNCEVEGKTFSILFISRRSRHRAGCRFTKRGIDESGNVANFVETEQILLFADGKVTSYVQVRGSIPIIWHSPVHMKYAPLVYIHDNRTRLIEVC